MALDYGTIQRKPLIRLKDKYGKTQLCVDLLPKTSEGNYYGVGEKCIVNRYYVARPDLISLGFFGSDEYGDVVCKINGISNPFELNEDDMLDLPSETDVRFMTMNNSIPSELIDTHSDITKSETSNQKKLTERRSPAEQVAGDTNYIIDKSLGLIFY